MYELCHGLKSIDLINTELNRSNFFRVVWFDFRLIEILSIETVSVETTRIKTS